MCTHTLGSRRPQRRLSIIGVDRLSRAVISRSSPEEQNGAPRRPAYPAPHHSRQHQRHDRPPISAHAERRVSYIRAGERSEGPEHLLQEVQEAHQAEGLAVQDWQGVHLCSGCALAPSLPEKSPPLPTGITDAALRWAVAALVGR